MMSTLKQLKNPLVSFCISTYKRPEFLVETVKKLLQQTYPHFEIIICDNDSSSKNEVLLKKLKSSKIHYYKNKKNIGMVPSFNKAFSLSKGEFIVFMSDDDPQYPWMLNDLVKLANKYPHCGAYFGAYHLYTPQLELAKKTKLNQGYISCRNFDWKHGAVKIFNPKGYLTQAFRGDIFYYLMWSTGIVRRSVVEKIHAIPEYGSALMSDRSYCLKVGAFGNVLIYNKELAFQTVHPGSFSLTAGGKDMLTKGFIGYYKNILPYLKKYDLEKEHENFLLRHVFNMIIIIKIGDELRNVKPDIKTMMEAYDEFAQEIPFLKKHKWKLQLMLWKPFPFEAILKAIDMPPMKVLKTAYRLIRYRIRSVKDLTN